MLFGKESRHINHEIVDVRKVIEHVAKNSIRVAHDGVMIETRICSNFHGHIVGDLQCIVAVVHNLLLYALKVATVGKIAMLLCSNEAHFVLKISIPEKMCDPFTYGSSLHVVKKIIQEHSGIISVEDEVDHGTCLTIHLPKVPPNTRKSLERSLRMIDGGTSTANAQGDSIVKYEKSSCAKSEQTMRLPNNITHSGVLAEQEPDHHHTSNVRVVMSIDDNIVNQIVMQGILTEEGYQVECCMSAAEAFIRLEESEMLPNIILLASSMRVMSGYEFTAQLRKTFSSDMLPIIMVCDRHQKEYFECANDVLVKPYKREELVAKIESLLALNDKSWWIAELAKSDKKLSSSNDDGAMCILRKILPDSVISRMQQGQKIVSDTHDHVIIMFSDIVEYTSMASNASVLDVFKLLSSLFSSFDQLIDQHGVFKVETIGDSYMVAAGHDHDDAYKSMKGSPAMRILSMAMDMLDVVENTVDPNGERLKIRIGIHCGPAMSGVIGLKSPRYCFIGDTVNIASRMQTNGYPMCIHVSEDFRNDVAIDSLFADAGFHHVKGKGVMRTFFLKHGEWHKALECKLATDVGHDHGPSARSGAGQRERLF